MHNLDRRTRALAAPCPGATPVAGSLRRPDARLRRPMRNPEGLRPLPPAREPRSCRRGRMFRLGLPVARERPSEPRDLSENRRDKERVAKTPESGKREALQHEDFLGRNSGKSLWGARIPIDAAAI